MATAPGGRNLPPPASTAAGSTARRGCSCVSTSAWTDADCPVPCVPERADAGVAPNDGVVAGSPTAVACPRSPAIAHDTRTGQFGSMEHVGGADAGAHPALLRCSTDNPDAPVAES